MAEPAADPATRPAPSAGAARPWHETTYRVRFDEAGLDGTAQAAVLLAWAQDAAWQHSSALGFDRAWYAARSVTWLVRAARVVIAASPPSGSDVVVRTEVVGFRRVLARRLTTYRSRDGVEFARSITDWALVDSAGRPTRMPVEIVRLAAVPSFDPLALEADVAVAAGGSGATGVAWRRVSLDVRLRDVDPLGHANNAAYLGYVDEALSRAGHERLVRAAARTYEIVYLRPIAIGSAVEVDVAVDARSARLSLRDEAGTTCTLAEVCVGDRSAEG